LLRRTVILARIFASHRANLEDILACRGAARLGCGQLATMLRSNGVFFFSIARGICQSVRAVSTSCVGGLPPAQRGQKKPSVPLPKGCPVLQHPCGHRRRERRPWRKLVFEYGVSPSPLPAIQNALTADVGASASSGSQLAHRMQKSCVCSSAIGLARHHHNNRV